MVLDAITLESFCAAIVHMHWEGHGDGTLGHHQAITMAVRNFQVIGDDAELLARHLKNVVFVDAQGGTHRFGGAGNSAWKSAICACSRPSSNRILRSCRLGFQPDSADMLRACRCPQSSAGRMPAVRVRLGSPNLR